MASLDSSEGVDPNADVADERQPPPDGSVLGDEAEERLARCIGCLPPLDREVILLRHFSEMSFKEIAELLQIPLGTALARAHRALERLRTEISHETRP
jgi:RNA polymerase sigma-70 factor (ECF subfamily)